MNRLFILFHGRFPSEKAAALFVALNARSFATHLQVTIVVPKRAGVTVSARDAYGLPSGISVVYLPTIDLFRMPLLRRLAFPISMCVFTGASFLYLLARAHRGDIVMSNEWLPTLAATLLPVRTVYEVHDFPERYASLYRSLFTRASLVIATNAWKHTTLLERFPVLGARLVMERNGVDVTAFSARDKTAARAALGLSEHARMAVYTGQLYAWKGIGTLLEAAQHIPDIHLYLVGGTQEAIQAFKDVPGNVHFVGQVPHAAVPLWQTAADVLVLPNTAREAISERYTSPMKLFEYMASGRPIVASRIPSITEVVTEDMAYLVAPDDAQALAKGIGQAIEAPDARSTRAQEAVQEYTWDKRTARIMEYLRA